MLIVWCPTQDAYSSTVSALRSVGVKWHTPPSARRVMVLDLIDEKWVVLPTDYYAAQRKKDGAPSTEEVFVDELIRGYGMTVYRPESDREYQEGDGDGGIGVPTPELV